MDGMFESFDDLLSEDDWVSVADGLLGGGIDDGDAVETHDAPKRDVEPRVDPTTPKRRGPGISADVVAALTAWAEAHPDRQGKPSADELFELSARFDMPEKRVSTWFNNYRKRVLFSRTPGPRRVRFSNEVLGVLNAWIREHPDKHGKPEAQDMLPLQQASGLNAHQLSNWFSNYRQRVVRNKAPRDARFDYLKQWVKEFEGKRGSASDLDMVFLINKTRLCRQQIRQWLNRYRRRTGIVASAQRTSSTFLPLKEYVDSTGIVAPPVRVLVHLSVASGISLHQTRQWFANYRMRHK